MTLFTWCAIVCLQGKQSKPQEREENKDEEQDAFDNLPESFQYSERGEQMEEYISDIEEAFDNLEEAEGLISEI